MNRISIKLVVLATALLFFCVATTVSGQQTNSKKDKPKVALVLSGGGAKGLAHIGVIKVLEEYGIKPDIITGTSMGSIVGSLYAAGYSVEEMTAINKNADWEALLTDDLNLRSVAMNVKPESGKYLFSFPIRDKKMRLPAGLIEGQHLEAYFAKLFWGLTAEEDFNKLPIPFHCMSVDLISGKTIEHQSGDLVKSIRASMAIPSVFTPVKMDSMLLVDGGVTRNFPVQEAIDMGADIIIGVYLGFDEDITANDLTSLTDILSRATVLGGIVDARKQFEKCDILILPDLGKYGAGDFTQGLAIQELGEIAARKQAGEIKALAEKYNLKLHEVEKINRPDKILITDIEVEGLQYLTEYSVIISSGILPGDSVSYRDIDESIEFMYGTTHYKGLSWSVKKDPKHEGYILVFHVKENPRSSFNMAANYDDDLGVGFVTNFTLKNIIAPATRFVATINIAENPAVHIKLNKKLGSKQRFSDNYFLNAYGFKMPFYQNGERFGTYHRSYFEGGYGIDYALGLNHQFGAKIMYRYNNLTPNTDVKQIYTGANFKNYKTNEWAYNIHYNVNTTDDVYFPKKGIKLDVEFTHAFHSESNLNYGTTPRNSELFIVENDEPYITIYAEHNWYKTFAKRITYNFGVGGGLSSDNADAPGVFMLGGSRFSNHIGYRNFAGFNFAEILTTNYSFVKSALNIELFSGLYLSGTVNVGNFANMYNDMFDNFTKYGVRDYTWGYNIGVKYDSLFGPMQFLVSDNNKDGETRFHLSIGFPF